VSYGGNTYVKPQSPGVGYGPGPTVSAPYTSNYTVARTNGISSQNQNVYPGGGASYLKKKWGWKNCNEVWC